MPQVREIQIPYLSASPEGHAGQAARMVTYDNGYTLVFVPKTGDVFNISTWVRTGSIHEDEQINGISHFLEHLMFKGTERFKPGEFDKAMESMGAIINAATWKDFTFYYITGPKGRAKEASCTIDDNFELALDMHADMMLGSTIPDEEVGPPYDPFDPHYQGDKRERSVVIEEISMREDQPWTKIYNAVNHMMYPDAHPYRRDVIGTRQIIGHIPRQAIVSYYRQWYTPKNLTTIVVGDFDFSDIEAKVAQYFDFTRFGIPDTAQGGALEHLPMDIPNGQRYVELTGDYQTTFFIKGFHAPAPGNLRESIALDVVSHVLGESRSSRLTQALLEKPANPIYNFVSCGQSTFKLGNVFFIQGNFADPSGVTAQETLALLDAEVDKLLSTEPITPEEFRRAVKKLKVNFAETSETASNIAESIGEALTVVGSLDSYLGYLDELNALDVETVNSVARHYLGLEQAYTAVMVPSGNPGTDDGGPDDEEEG